MQKKMKVTRMCRLQIVWTSISRAPSEKSNFKIDFFHYPWFIMDSLLAHIISCEKAKSPALMGRDSSVQNVVEGLIETHERTESEPLTLAIYIVYL